MVRGRLLRLGLLAVVAAAAVLLGTGGNAGSAPAPNPIQVENAKPGTPGWDDFSSVAQQDAISGFGSKISVDHGDSLDLYVTTTAASVTIDIFRVGWYGGVGARLIESLGTFPGVHQAIPPPDPVTGMVSCDGWTKTTTLNVPSDWVTGVYLAKLSASSGNKSFILFIVRDDGGTEPIVFQSSVTTAQAYNVWGGVSLYDNRTNKAIYKYPAATKVTFDRPFDPEDGNGAGQFFAFEYPFVRWAESQGYDMTYITDVDTHTNVNPLTNHRVFLSVGHDEYWTKGMRDNVADAIAHGVNAAFFSANSMYWQIRLEPNAEGVPNRVQVGYKDSSTSTSPPGPDPEWKVNNAIVTTRWRDDPVNNPENGLIGVMYQDQVQRDYAYVVQNSGNWIYSGTGFSDGTSIPGIVGYEYDKVWNNGASPPGLTVLSNSPVVGCCEGSGNSFSNSTLYTAPSGARVFASGTIQWSWGLDNYSAHYANAGIQRTTANILDAFSAPAGPAPAVSFSSGSVGFGSQLVGVPSSPSTVTVTNSGTAALTITSIGVTGANAGDFSSTSTCPLAPATLAAGGTCTVSLTFTPSATGTRSASLAVADDAAGSPQTVTLSGTGSTGPSPAAVPMPLISRGVPAYASSALSPASFADDGDYTTYWNGSIPSWLAYDLSSVPAAQRGRVIVAWYNDPLTSPYDHALFGEPAYDSLRDYTIQANAAPGGGTSAPATGWVTLVTVTGNHFHSRQHLVDLTGYNWVRIDITAGDGSAGNTNAAFNLDVHDASRGAGDSWVFYGDSITMDGMHHEPVNGAGNYSQLVAASTGSFPAYEDGGIGGTIAQTGATNIGSWLSIFPGKYVALAYGTNDANGCGDTSAFYAAYVTMVRAVLQAGKIPVVPTIPWARTANVQSCGPAFVAQIQALYAAYPEIVRGPDLWSFFKANPGLISSDDLHPSAAGYAAYRQQWANAMLAAVYSGTVAAPAVSLSPSSVGFGSVAVGATSASQPVTLTNTGTAALAISSIGTAGANASDFTAGGNCPVAPATLAAGGSCTISVAFTPSATGSRTASLQVADNAPGTPQTVALTGTGASTTPAVSLSPTSVSFGSQPVGSPTAQQSVTLRNSGGGTLTISGISLAGTSPGDFTMSNGCPATLAPNATCTIGVVFTPSATGSRSASIRIADDAADSPQSVPLSGTGFVPGAVAFDKSLGTKTDNVGGSTMTLTTGAAAVTQSRVFAFVVWNSSAQTLSSVTGGGLTWTVDVQTRDGNNDHVAVASADAGLGLASGTVITAVFSGSVTHGLIAAASFTGLAPGTPADATSSRTQAGVAAWSAPLTVPNANDLVVGFSVVDANATDTPAAPNAEIHDFGDVNYYGWATSVYQVAATAGTATVGGTWSRTGGTANGTVVAAYRAAAGAVPAPAVSLTPPSLSFGSALVGTTTATQSSVLRNTGTAALSISSIAAAGANAGDFTVADDCPSSLPAGASCTVSVAFAPTAAGGRSAAVRIVDDASDSPQSIALSGTGTTPAPAVTLTPASLSFGSVNVGATSASQSSTVKNTGTGTLTISGISLAGANAGDFAQTSTCSSTLAPGASCTITVTFTPSASGTRAASVQLTDDAAGSPQSLALGGTGAAPAVTLQPPALAFGSQTTGTTSAPLTSTLTNSGNAPLTITGITVVGESGADFAQTNTCASTLAAGASCTISATFTPSAAVPRSAGIRIADDAADSPQILGLSGTGVAPAPGASVSPASLSFGSILVGSSSAAQTVTLTNTGAGALTIASIAVAGTNAGDFAQTATTCGGSLAAGASCSVDVDFAPTAAGSRSATLQFSDDAAGSPQSVSLAGVGATPAPAVSLSPTTLAFGSQRVGTTSATQAVVVTNSGNAPLSITSVGIAGANGGDFAIASSTCPTTTTLGAGLSCSVLVSFTPSATGGRSASLQIVDDAAGSPHTVALTGTGTAPAVSVSPSSLAFGSVLLGSSSMQPVTVTNSGTATLAISAISVTGANAGDFTLGGAGCPSTLAAGASCTLQVTFAPGAAGARSAAVSIADDAAGSPQTVPLGGTGSTSSVAFDRNLGTKTENVGGANMKLVTSAAATAGTRVFIFVEWNNASRVLSSVSGGGLTWRVDYQAKGVNNNHLAIASAPAPAGLAAGVTLTASFSGSVTHGLIAAASFAGVGSTLDGTATATGTGTRAWSADVTTTAAADLVLGFSTIDANTTDLPTAPSTEIHDFGNSAYYAWSTTVYQVTAAAGSVTVAGTWAANAGATANLTIAVAYRGS